MPHPTLPQWEDIAEGFETRWQFPNCLGAIDGKHVLIFAPRNSGSVYFNYKKTFSVVLLALVDHQYCFSAVDIGSVGSNSDGGIYRNSLLSEKLKSGQLDIPKDKPLPGGGAVAVPFVIVGDEAFPSEEHLVRPYPGDNLTMEERVFNYRLSRARRVSENAFGILANRWRLYHRKIPLQPENVDKVVKATCVLHNMLQRRGIPVPPPPMQPEANGAKGGEQGIHDGILRELNRRRGRPTLQNTAVRQEFKNYFVSAVGAVPWQYDNLFGAAN